jgi:cytochrome c peroxidase
VALALYAKAIVQAVFFILAAMLAIPLGLDLYMPVPEDNPVTEDKIEAGRRLFFDRRLSRDRSISCSSCHVPELGFSDGRPVAVGVFNRVGRRSAPALINRGYGSAFFWDGRAATLEEQVLQPIQDANEMDLTLAEASARVGLPVDDISRSLASFVRSLLSGNSRFDRFIDGDRDALSPEQQAGLQIFRNKGSCTACHVGPTFSDERFHNTGVAFRDGRLLDDGRFIITGKSEDRGAFKTPTLRDIARTAPYMHDGSIATLGEVVEFYDRGGNENPSLDPELRPLRLTPSEKANLIVFLESLTGAP